MSRKGPNSLIGLEIGGRRLTAVELFRESGNRVKVRRVVQEPLLLDPWTAEPELAAGEIRNLLDGSGIRTSHCVVCLPLSQVMTYQTEIPTIEEEDVPAFLEIEAENAFPFAPEDLVISISRAAEPDGSKRAILAAAPTNHLQALERVLRLAKLRPASITLGTLALLEFDAKGTSEAVIVRSDSGVEFFAAAGGGLAALRVLSEPQAPSDRENEFDADSLVRECRITLGRLPVRVRESLQKIRLYTPQTSLHAMLTALNPEIESLGMVLEPSGVDVEGRVVRAEGASCPAGVTLTASRWMQGERPLVEFLRSRPGRARQFTRRLMARGILWQLSSIAAVVVLIVAGAFAWQRWRLEDLERRSRLISPEVTRLAQLQKEISEYRAWYDDAARSLEIALALTKAFPERGNVWTRSLEIKNLSDVTCTGLAQTNDDYLAMLNALRRTAGVEDLQVGSMRGDKPIQFSLSYHWRPGGNNGS